MTALRFAVGCRRRLFGQSLQGVIDIHAHTDPDSLPRSIDAIDLARLAKSRGMRGLVLKNHYEATASLAYIVRKEVPGHRNLWRHRPEPHCGRNQSGGCRAHDHG